MNTSIVSNISELAESDFNMIVEHMLSKPKKTRRPKTYQRRIHSAHSVPALNVIELLNVPDEEHAVNATFAAANSDYCNASMLNDTCFSATSEQFEELFAYFDQDVNTSHLISDSDEDEHPYIATPKESVASKPTKDKKKSSNRQNLKEMRDKSKEVLRDIQHSKSALKSRTVQRASYIPNRTVSSSVSTALAHDSDSDTAFKKPTEVINGNVRSKVAFFSDYSSTERSSSVSPSLTSSDDEGYQPHNQSTNSFKQNLEFFEKFFKGDNLDHTEISTENESNNSSTEDLPNSQNPTSDRVNVFDKLDAIRTYAQTEYILERIHQLAKGLLAVNEHRLSTMNLRLMAKVLNFVRDCSQTCKEVCTRISENFLNDEEKAMNAEELLFLALKEVYLVQVLHPLDGLFSTHFRLFSFCDNFIDTFCSFFRFQPMSYIPGTNRFLFTAPRK